jgi:hypothetical protein
MERGYCPRWTLLAFERPDILENVSSVSLPVVSTEYNDKPLLEGLIDVELPKYNPPHEVAHPSRRLLHIHESDLSELQLLLRCNVFRVREVRWINPARGVLFGTFHPDHYDMDLCRATLPTEFEM